MTCSWPTKKRLSELTTKVTAGLETGLTDHQLRRPYPTKELNLPFSQAVRSALRLQLAMSAVSPMFLPHPTARLARFIVHRKGVSKHGHDDNSVSVSITSEKANNQTPSKGDPKAKIK